MDYRQQQFNAKSIELTWINLYKWPLKAEVHRINLMLYMWRNRRCIIHLEFLKHSETIFCWKVPCACESENVLLFLDNAWMRTVRITQEKIHLIFLSYFTRYIQLALFKLIFTIFVFYKTFSWLEILRIKTR